MIILEYLIAQHQDGNTSVAINSSKPRQQNPALNIVRVGANYHFELRGLHLGVVEQVVGQPRTTHLDFYIGMEDLIEQRNVFPVCVAAPLALVDGLRVPAGRERAGGKQIRWSGPVHRMEIEDIKMIIPPFSLIKNANSPIILNIDRETSPYPIVSDGGNRTTRQLHFGFEHVYNIRQRNNLRIPRISFDLSPNQYSTLLSAVDASIVRYNAI